MTFGEQLSLLQFNQRWTLRTLPYAVDSDFDLTSGSRAHLLSAFESESTANHLCGDVALIPTYNATVGTAPKYNADVQMLLTYLATVGTYPKYNATVQLLPTYNATVQAEEC